MAVTVSMAKALGLSRLAVPTQGNAGDALAEYAVAGGLEAAIVMSPDTDLPVLGKVAAYAKLYPDLITLELVAGTIVESACCASANTSCQPGFSVWPPSRSPGGVPRARRPSVWKWRNLPATAGPNGSGSSPTSSSTRREEAPAWSEWPKRSTNSKRLGLIGPERPRMVCVQSEATTPLVRAFDAGADDITLPPGTTLATGLNVARNVGHINVLRIIRESGGAAIAVTDDAIRDVIRDEWRERQFAWSPEGAATLAALPEMADRGLIRAGDRVVLVNTAAAGEKYLPKIRTLLDGDSGPFNPGVTEAVGAAPPTFLLNSNCQDISIEEFHAGSGPISARAGSPRSQSCIPSAGQ